MHSSRARNGFTLFELAIVLVVISLLVAATLLGRDLIRAAQVRAQASQIEMLNLAVKTFRLKYNCLPGDCAYATEFGLGDEGGDGDNGNGNGILEITETDGILGFELENFWYHLSQAQLISEHFPVGSVPGVNSPALKMRGQGLSDNPAGGIWFGTIANNKPINNIAISGGQINMNPLNAWMLSSDITGAGSLGVYLPLDAFMLDSKLDDGLPRSGSVMATADSMGSSNPGGCGGAPICGYSAADPVGANACIVNNGTLMYNTTITARTNLSLCAPVIRANF